MSDLDEEVASKQLTPMTKEQVESWVQLKAQTGERWFKVVVLDEEVGQDPTVIALMETVSEMIFAGIQNIPFAEVAKPKVEIVKG